ncbi:sensor histidine kinase [Pontimicrobium sp. SW4]|uniref:histidine kinase n=1 Tax=Pontimicrobium sp. SW4 TaxID=3153519 RepID=A0AAU7BUP0_9FLAO
MIKNLLTALIFFICSNTCFSQFDTSTKTSVNDYTKRIEKLIIEEELDSASYYISLSKITDYNSLLKNIALENPITYNQWYSFIVNASKQFDIEFHYISNFINKYVKEPINTKDINLDYVKLKWFQIYELRDRETVEDANFEHEKLLNYINRFKKEKEDVVKARLWADTHKLVLFEIQFDLENGKSLCLKNLEIARELDDKELIIAFLYHLCDFYIIEGNLDAYIKTSEECLETENSIANHTHYYQKILINLLDAYIYKGGYNERVKKLLQEMSSTQEGLYQSYSLYAKFLGTLENDSKDYQSVLKEFKVNTLLEFCSKINELGKGKLNPNDYCHLVNESANTLFKKGYTNEAFQFKNKALSLLREIYSQDLSKSLVSFSTKQAVRDKEAELKYQEERTNLYVIIASLTVALLIITLFFLLKKRTQSNLLKLKNKQIEINLKEKELLVKEVHHRVKNNFQIVSSLLELQSKGIEDKKAIELVNDGKVRIKSMALIHQKLYQNENGLIDFEDYVFNLVNELATIYAPKKKIRTNIKVSNIFFDVDTAIPLGLIINELITNAYKHAFLENEGDLKIEIRKETEEDYILEIVDNGVGISNEAKIKNNKSLGLYLVNRLTKQLQGKLTFKNENGAHYKIVFKDAFSRKLID